MPRSGKINKRTINPDPVYNSRLLSRFINRVMVDGKKETARNLVYKALDQIGQQGDKNPLTVFETAISNISPRMEVKPRRIGGASYQIPIEVRGDRKEALAIRWLIEAARNRSNSQFHSFDLKLAAEILDAADNKGSAISKKENTLRAAEANKAFAHFRF